MFLCIYSEDTYPFEVIRHHDHCKIPSCDFASLEVERDVNNIDTHYHVDMGHGDDGVYHIEIEDCECDPPELHSAIDTRNSEVIPF